MTTTHQKTKDLKDSGIEWVGVVPNDWTSQRRGKFVFRSSKEINKNMSCDNVLSLTMRGVISRSELGEGGLLPSDYSTFQIFYNDDLVFKLIDLANFKTSRVGIVHEKGIMSSAYIRTYPINKNATYNKYFYYYYFNLYLQGIYNFIGMGVRSTMNASDLLDMEVVIPPLETQKRIADFLDEKTATIDVVIEKKQKLIELLKEQRTAIITKAVTKGLDPKAKMKDSGVEWISEIPEGWEIKKIRHLTAINKKSLSERETAFDYEFKYVDIGNVNNRGEIVRLQDYTFGNAPSRARRLAENGDVIISTVRTYLRSMAKVKNSENLVFSTGFAILHPVSISDSFLFWAMQSETFLSTVMSESVGIHYPGINQYNLSSIKIGVPQKEAQNNISNYLNKASKPIDQRLSKITEQINKLKEYRASIIYNAVTGKITI